MFKSFITVCFAYYQLSACIKNLSVKEIDYIMCDHTKHDILIVEGCLIQLKNETHPSKSLSVPVIYSKKLLWNDSNCLIIIVIKC